MKVSTNQIKVRFEEPKFSVHKEQGVVVCNLDFEVNVPCLREYCTLLEPLNGTYSRVVGVARCSGNDEFNEHTGKEIAFAKAESKAYAKAKKFLSKQVNVLNQYIDFYNNFAGKCDSVVFHNNEYVKRIDSEVNA